MDLFSRSFLAFFLPFSRSLHRRRRCSRSPLSSCLFAPSLLLSLLLLLMLYELRTLCLLLEPETLSQRTFQ